MCGRARLSSDVSEIKLAFSIPPERPAPNFCLVPIDNFYEWRKLGEAIRRLPALARLERGSNA
jgi:hypothetical protein